MDVLTVALSVLLAIPVQFCVMFLVYSRWILPAINGMVATLPTQIREFVEPFVNDKIDEVQRSVKASSARFQRTVNQAVNSLDLDEIDLETEDGIETAKNKIQSKYGLDVAVNAISQLIASVEASKKASEPVKGGSVW